MKQKNHIMNPNVWYKLKAKKGKVTNTIHYNLGSHPLNNWRPSKTIQEVICHTKKDKWIETNSQHTQKAHLTMQCSERPRKPISNKYQYAITANLELVESPNPNHFKELSLSGGGIIVFPNDFDKIDAESKIMSSVKNKIQTLKKLVLTEDGINGTLDRSEKEADEFQNKMSNDTSTAVVCSIGNFLANRYVCEKNKVFDVSSLCVMISGIPTTALFYFAEGIAQELQQENILVQDLNENRFFIIS